MRITSHLEKNRKIRQATMTDLNFCIDTPRLTLSHFDPASDEHCDFLNALWTQPSALRATGGIAITTNTREKARAQLQLETERIHPETGYGRYRISLKIPSTPIQEDEKHPFYPNIGTVTMKCREYVDTPVIPDIGFGLLEEYEGKGYATEAASALIKYFEDVKGQREFLGLVHPDNQRSIAMMRRLGFREEGTRKVLGITNDGSAVEPLCWSRGLKGELPRVVQIQRD